MMTQAKTKGRRDTGNNATISQADMLAHRQRRSSPPSAYFLAPSTWRDGKSDNPKNIEKPSSPPAAVFKAKPTLAEEKCPDDPKNIEASSPLLPSQVLVSPPGKQFSPGPGGLYTKGLQNKLINNPGDVNSH
jgi:hypothetical protein